MFLDEPTHYPYSGNTPTTIDIAINKNVSFVSRVTALQELTSDHNPIIITLSSQNKSNINKIQYAYKNVDWDEFNLSLNEKVKINNKIENTLSIDTEVQKLTNNIQNQIIQSIPTKTFSHDHDKLPQYILDMISSRNKIRKK